MTSCFETGRPRILKINPNHNDSLPRIIVCKQKDRSNRKYVIGKLILLHICASHLEMDKATIFKINPNNSSLSMIIVRKFDWSNITYVL